MLAPIAHILIVDDEPTSMRALCDTLHDEGYRTTGCNSGEAALKLMRDGQFDLLLTDLMMPKMDGVALLTEALKIDAQIVGVLMTGRGTIETAVQAMKAGALDYVLKPIKLAEILPVLSRAVGIRRLRLENMALRDTVAIHELNQAIAHTLDPHVLLDKIADAALAQFEADESSVMLLKEDGKSLYVAAVRGEQRNFLLGEQLPLGMGIAGKVAQTREPMLISGAWADTYPISPSERSASLSSLSMPMITRNQLIGVLNVSSNKRQQPFTFGQIKVFSVFTNAAAAGIEAARLHDRQRRADARYREVLDMAVDGIISADENLHIVVFNQAAESLFGYSVEEVMRKPIDLLFPENREEIQHFLTQVFAQLSDDSQTIHSHIQQAVGRKKDGSRFDAEVGLSKHVERDKALFTTVVRDVTLRNQQAEKIARLTRIQQVLSGINSAIVRIHDRNLLLKEACRIARTHGGFEIAWIGIIDPELGEIATSVCEGAPEGSEISRMRAAIARNPGRDDEGLLRRAIGSGLRQFSNDLPADAGQDDGCIREAVKNGFRSAIALPLLLDYRTVGVLALFSQQPGVFDDEELLLLDELAGDISFALDHMAKNEKLNYLAFYDALTRLPNRALFNDRLEQWVDAATREGKQLAVIALNLERFRNINETLGRQVGDELLRQVGRRLKAAMPSADMAARINADHFALAVWQNDGNGSITAVLDALLSAVFGDPYEAGGAPLRLSARAGIAIFPDHGGDAEAVYHNAEAALRAAKQMGVPYLLYAPQMKAMDTRELLMETHLRNAVEAAQFVLHYQPKIDLATNRICGFEALIRWNDPETGLVPPDQFIPLLEETGLIFEVGRWAIGQALKDHRAWSEMGLAPPPVSVNVSAIQIRRKDFVDMVRHILGEQGETTHGLNLEITESILMGDIEDNISKLKALTDIAVHIHVDDFGTGYSSLAYLTKLPVSTLKIDQSFVGTMHHSPESLAVVSTIISLAHSLGLNVVAEGVETKEQAESLRRLNCDEAQGFLYSRPVPAADVVSLLRR